MAFIDFAALKASIPLEEAVAMLGLQMKPAGNQLRGTCPACRTTGGRELVVTPSKSAFYCFSAKKGGDLIAFVAHIRNQSVKEAAAFLADRIGGMSTSTVSTSTTSTSTVPAQGQGQPEPDNRLEKVAARLDHEHPEVQALGLTPAVAEALGIGYDKRGMMKGRVLFPLYDDGELVGFLGYAADLKPAVKLPPNLTGETPQNVVPIRAVK